jgi:hypothetical protein
MGGVLPTDSNGRSESVREDVADRYYKTKPGELGRGFFRRDSTRKYIDALASLEDVTIYAGAGVSADVGAPLSDELMPYILGRWVKEHPDLKAIDKDKRGRIENRITDAIAKAYPPAYIGSIAREFARRERPKRDPEKKHRFRTEIEEANQVGYTSGGFLARSVGALAFALKRKGKSVGIITTNYDRTIIDEQEKIVEHFRDLASDCDYFFEARTSATSDEPIAADEIPVFHVNGAVSDDSHDPFVIGEVDFFAWYDQQLEEHQPENQKWRRERLDDALLKGACLFVGSSLTDPDVLAKLAETKFLQPRYAVLLAPDQENEPDGSALLELGEHDTHDEDGSGDEDGIPKINAIERCIARDVVAQRFLHLGVIPIMVDFPHQVPQLLTEIALRVQQGESYRGYSDRLLDWWPNWAEQFGFADEETAGDRDFGSQFFWAEKLGDIRNSIRELLELDDPSEKEKIMVEVWVRNPKTRTLFLWATSEGIWLNGDTALWCDLGDSDTRFGAQRGFRKGRTHAAEIRPRRGLWAYGVSVPLTLHKPPWHHLPVGMISVRSSEVKGELWKAADRFEDLEELERLLLEPTSDLLDPNVFAPSELEQAKAIR